MKTIVFCFVFQSFSKTIVSFLEKKTIVFKDDLRPFLYDCFFKTRSLLKIWFFLLTIMLTIVKERSSLTIVNIGLSLTKWRTVVFGKTIVLELYATYWLLSYMKLNSCGGAKCSWYFLRNYLMISIGISISIGAPSGPFTLFLNNR